MRALMLEISKNNSVVYELMEKFGFRAYDKKLLPIANGDYRLDDIFLSMKS